MREVLFFGDSHLWTVRVEEKEQDALWSVVTRNPHPAGSPGLEKKSPWVVLLQEYSTPTSDVNDSYNGAAGPKSFLSAI